MVLTPDGIAMDVKPKQRIKVQSGMSFRRCERRTVFKLVHFFKNLFSDNCHAVWKLYFRQGGAVIKSASSKGCDTVWNFDAL